MFFVHQNKDDDDIKDIVTNITSFKDIDINDIKNTDYLLIDLDGTVIDRVYRESDHYILSEEFYKKYYNIHNTDCRFLKRIEINIHKKGLNFFYITEHDINNTIKRFKEAIPKINICALSRSWPGILIKGKYYQTDQLIYSREDQLRNLGINTIDKYIWTNHIDKGVFLCGWNGSLKEYCKCCYDLNDIEVKNQPGYFDLNPEMVGKNIVVVDDDINQLNYIYKAYKAKYPQYINKLKLYLYINPFVSSMASSVYNVPSALNSMENEYCDCNAKTKINGGK